MTGVDRGEVDRNAAYTQRVMVGVAERFEAVLFGMDRSLLAQFEIGDLKLYARDLRGMTAEEVESAVLGFVGWENLPDEPVKVYGDKNVPDGLMLGLSAWLPPVGAS